MREDPITVSGVILLAVLGGCFAIDLLDMHTLLRVLVAPFRAILLHFPAITFGAIAVLVPALLLEYHGLITPWPGVISTCVAFAFLLAMLVSPHRVYRGLSLMATNLHTFSAAQKRIVFEFLRGRRQSFEEVARKLEEAEEKGDPQELGPIQKNWELQDTGKNDVRYDVTGWYIAIVCLLLIIHIGSVFRSLYLLDAGKSDLKQALFIIERPLHAESTVDSMKDRSTVEPDTAYTWIMLGIETFLFRGEITFDAYDTYQIDAPALLSYMKIQPSRAMSLVVFIFRITVSLLLANMIFSHFQFGQNALRLLQSVRRGRYEGCEHNTAYQGLRILRPLIESQLLAYLKRSVLKETSGQTQFFGRYWREFLATRFRLLHGKRAYRFGWEDVLCILSLLRSWRAKPELIEAISNENIPFQVRLAAFCSLCQSGGKLPLSSLEGLLMQLDLHPDSASFRQQVESRGWIVAKRQESDSELVSAWCSDVLRVVIALKQGRLRIDLGKNEDRQLSQRAFAALRCSEGHCDIGTPKNIGGKSPNLLSALMDAADGGRAKLLSALALAPRWSEPLSQPFVTYDFISEPLNQNEREVLRIVARLRSARADSVAAAMELTQDIVDERTQRVITHILLQQLENEEIVSVRRSYLSALARVGIGDSALASIISQWQLEQNSSTWKELLSGIDRLWDGAGDAFQLLAYTYEREGLVDELRWLLWRTLCLRAEHQLLAERFGIRSRLNSLGNTLRLISSGEQTVNGMTYTLDSFWIADFPTTVQDWHSFLVARNDAPALYHLPEHFDYLRCLRRVVPGFFEPSQPIVEVSWWHAAAFCRWLTDVEAMRGDLPVGYVYRLPTEVEWQYCATAGQAASRWYGECQDAAIVNSRNATRSRHPSCRDDGYPNQWGIFDVLGNVWEWCLNSSSATIVHSQPPPGSCYHRALRGGSWRTQIEDCHGLKRAGWAPDSCLEHVGFRVVLALPMTVISKGESLHEPTFPPDNQA